MICTRQGAATGLETDHKSLIRGVYVSCKIILTLEETESSLYMNICEYS